MDCESVIISILSCAVSSEGRRQKRPLAKEHEHSGAEAAERGQYISYRWRETAAGRVGELHGTQQLQFSVAATQLSVLRMSYFRKPEIGPILQA